MNIDVFGVFVSNINDFFTADCEAVLCGEVAYSIRYLANGEDIHIRLNTEGGDVEGGKAIASALRDYIHDYPQAHITVECESLVASAGANLLTQIPRTENVKILAHRDTQIMFHASSACIFGGADMLRDYAKSMDDYNKSIKQWLKEHTTLEAGKIDAWFEEGRVGWLSADEALSCGLINGIMEDASITLANPAEENNTQVAQYARTIRDAYAKQVAKIGESKMTEEEKTEEEKLTLPEGGNTITEPSENPEAECPEEEVKPVADKAPAEPAPEAPAEEVKPTEDVEALKARIAELEELLKKTEEEKEVTEKAMAKLSAGLTIKQTASAPNTWREVVASIKATAKTQEAFDDAYAKAKAQYADLFRTSFNR